MSRARLTRDRGDTGLTLIELLVAMVISSIVLAGVGAVTMASTRASRIALVRTENSRELRGVVEAMVVTLRVATAPPGDAKAFGQATPTDMLFYSRLNRSGSVPATDHPPTQVRWWWDANTTCIYEQRSLGVPIVPLPASGFQHTYTTGVTTLCAARTTKPPEFRYYTSSTSTTPIPNTSAGLSEADMATIRSVEVVLQIDNPRSPDVKGSQVIDRVTLVNLG